MLDAEMFLSLCLYLTDNTLCIVSSTLTCKVHCITCWMFHCFLSLKHMPHWENPLYYVLDADLNTFCITCFMLNCFLSPSVCLTENVLYNPDGHSWCGTAFGPEPILHREHSNNCKHCDFSTCHTPKESMAWPFSCGLTVCLAWLTP